MVPKVVGMGRKKRLDKLGRIMSKVSRGEPLTKRERAMLSTAIDASKKAKSEIRHKQKKRKRRKRKVRALAC